MDLTLVLNDDEAGDCLFDDSELDFNTLFENVSPPASPHGQLQHTSSSPQGGSPTGRAHSPGKTNWSAMVSFSHYQPSPCEMLTVDELNRDLTKIITRAYLSIIRPRRCELKCDLPRMKFKPLYPSLYCLNFQV